MNSSQDSIFCNSLTDLNFSQMDAVSYEALVSSTKLAFSKFKNEIREPTHPAYFSTLLEDCAARISQSLGLITDILLESDIHRINLIGYLNNAVSLLRLLSDCIQNMIETVSMSCCNMKTFPITVGHIIKTVFIHCRNSESLYGIHLKSVEEQLQDLFRTCHELQVTYLMVLEKHFIFDLTVTEQQGILIEVLNINLNIADIVVCLDVKTTAEQWKGYIALCEKYSSSLMDKSIYDDCTRVLCAMAETNIKTTLEPNQQDKVFVRSLKMSHFTLKLLLRICTTFRHATVKDPTYVLELLLYIYMNDAAYLETVAQKSTQFINLFDINVLISAHTLVSELVVDETFVNCVFSYDVNRIRSDDKLLGLTLLVLAMIKALLRRNNEPTVKFQKQKFIDLIYGLIPYCHVWFNIGLKFKLGWEHTCGLYEHLLMHNMTLAVTMTTNEFNALEKKMVEAILSTDCYSAMFSISLWKLLARAISRELLLNQVVSLCQMYQTLENNTIFADSPQQIQLSAAISCLFQTMLPEDRTKIYNLYDVKEDKNSGLWTVLRICNLPIEVQSDAEAIVIDKFKTQFRKMLNENIMDIDDLIRIMNLASTCQLVNMDKEMEMLIIKAWNKACPRNNACISNITKVISKGTVWYYRYVRALVMITSSMENIFYNSGNLVMVLHTISEITQSGSTEIKLQIINILCKLANFPTQDMNRQRSVSIITKIFRGLFHDSDTVVRNKLFNDLRKHASYNLDRIISKVINEDDSLRRTWVHFERHGTLSDNSTNTIKQQLQAVGDNKYTHKCMDDSEVLEQPQTVSLTKVKSSNFDFADIETFFDTEYKQPDPKKVKPNPDGVVDEIISRLEEDALALSKVKENLLPEYQKRIKRICNRLANVLECSV